VGILKTHRNKPWFNQECSELVNKKKQAKLLRLKNPNDQTAEDLTNIRTTLEEPLGLRNMIT
jgi:hypothetical protein